jgi:hypothetical protein
MLKGFRMRFVFYVKCTAFSFKRLALSLLRFKCEIFLSQITE